MNPFDGRLIDRNLLDEMALFCDAKDREIKKTKAYRVYHKAFRKGKLELAAKIKDKYKLSHPKSDLAAALALSIQAQKQRNAIT